MINQTLTAVPGVWAGHWTHETATTGVTAILFPDGARGGVWVPGSATGSREMGVLAPTHLAAHLHGICLAGGSAFGLSAADGLMEVLEERNLGFATPYGLIPIVPAAILFDLHTAKARPDRAAGRLAAEAASQEPVVEGPVGAAAGARVGGASGKHDRGGVGTWAAQWQDWTVGALAAVNALGSVRDPETGRWVAGGPPAADAVGEVGRWRGQTTLVVVATDAPLVQGQLQILAKMASAGMARTLFPAFTPFDGDVVFSVSTGTTDPVDPVVLAALGDLAARCVERAIVRGVRA
jgi:L-aminopeptidase/D-esterase-like protein